MAKAKSPKLWFSFLTSFQICRPKKPCSMIKSPLPNASHRFSPLNSRTFDISFPGCPIPPPSTPSKITPLASKPCTAIQETDDEPDWRVSPSTSGKKKEKNMKYKSKSRISAAADCSETDSLFYSPPNFNSAHPMKPVCEDGSKKHVKPRRFKRYGSKEWKGDECNEKKPILEKVVPCKVNQSFVVVKKSVDPYEDFKNSMLEMILEKQIFEPKELEQLLMSFLSLNSRMHHKVIREAFTEILKEVFSE